MTDQTRRRFLYGSIFALIPLSGCGAYDYPQHRALLFESVKRVSSEGNRVVYEVLPKSSSSGGDSAWRTFHGVSLVAFGAGESEVGRVPLGDVAADWEHDTVEIDCSSRAVVMTYVAEE